MASPVATLNHRSMTDLASMPAPVSTATRLSGIVSAELLKLARRPAAWALLAAAAVLNTTFTYVVPYVSYVSGNGSGPSAGATPEELLASVMPERMVFNSIGAFAAPIGALALVLGALMFGGEYGWGTFKTLLTQRAGRTAVLTGQFAALAVVVLGGVVTLVGLSALSTTTIALVEGHTMAWPNVSDLAQGVGYGWLILFMWAVIGATLGITFRSVALPIGLGVVWILGVETLVFGVGRSVLRALEPVANLLPAINSGSLINSVQVGAKIDGGPPLLNDGVGAGRAVVTLACYIAVSIMVTVWTVRRRDVV